MVALYGATAEIHDHITRTPGSFAATMQGFAYLREAKAGFIVQLIPMRANYHEFDAMIAACPFPEPRVPHGRAVAVTFPPAGAPLATGKSHGRGWTRRT